MRVFHHGDVMARFAEFGRFAPPSQQFWQPLLLVVFEVLFADAKEQRPGDKLALRHGQDLDWQMRSHQSSINSDFAFFLSSKKIFSPASIRASMT